MVFESIWLLCVLVSPFHPWGSSSVKTFTAELCQGLFCRVVVTSCKYLSPEIRCLGFSEALCTPSVMRLRQCITISYGFAASGQNSHGKRDSEANGKEAEAGVGLWHPSATGQGCWDNTDQMER